MKRILLKFGLLCLMLVFAFIAKAQDVTAEWEFEAVGEGHDGGMQTLVDIYA